MGEIMNIQMGGNRVFRKEWAYPAPHVAHPSRFTQNNETSHMSQLVNKPFNICDTEVSNL